MKRDFLKGLGLDDEVINQIMDENGKDINNTKSNLSAELENLKKENETLKTQNTELDSQFKASKENYKDYEELKQFKADYEAKELNSKRVEYLKAQGCKHPDLIAKQINWDKEGVAYSDEEKTFKGLDEDIKTLKTNYADLFESNDTQHVTPDNKGAVTTGAESDFFKRYKEENPNLKW